MPLRAVVSALTAPQQEFGSLNVVTLNKIIQYAKWPSEFGKSIGEAFNDEDTHCIDRNGGTLARRG